MQPCSCRWVVWVCFLQGAVGAELRGASASHPKNKCEAVRIGPHTAQSSAYCLLPAACSNHLKLVGGHCWRWSHLVAGGGTARCCRLPLGLAAAHRHTHESEFAGRGRRSGVRLGQVGVTHGGGRAGCLFFQMTAKTAARIPSSTRESATTMPMVTPAGEEEEGALRGECVSSYGAARFNLVG